MIAKRAGVLLLVLGAISCGRQESVMVKTVHDRAKFDFECEEIKVTRIGDETYGAAGCGRRASYVIVDGSCGDSGVKYCKAVMNSETHCAK